MSEIINRRAELKDTTPMMKQYLEVKEQYEQFVLFYRLGDFYECFFDDALIASRELELTLTARDCGNGRRAAMCGVPFHKSDVYVGKLVEKGFKVAICEQVEDPKSATGLVRREVTRVVTPGTITDASLLNETKNNYLASLFVSGEGLGFAVADISTAEVSATFLDGDDALTRLYNELGAFQPSELITNASEEELSAVGGFAKERFGTMVNYSFGAAFAYEKANERIKAIFPNDIDKLPSIQTTLAVGALLVYIQQTQKTDVAFTEGINVYAGGQYLDIDLNTKRNLELTEAMRTKDKRGSLLWVLDKTKTAMGARLLRQWILRPLINPAKIVNRQSAVADLVKNVRVRDSLTELLSAVFDLERLTAKAVYGSANARDLRAIYQSIEKLPELKELVSSLSSQTIAKMTAELDTLDDIAELLSNAIVDDPPLTVREGGMIREGFNADVDYYRNIKNNGKEIMQSIEQREKEETGIRTLKVDYNKVFGYYIEVSKSFINEVPDRYVRKQTLTNCERYITQELKEMESSIFSAEDKLVSIEYEIFNSLRQVISDNNERIRGAAAFIAELDVYRSLAEVASKNGYVRREGA